ncbi:MAG: hypothetical protein HC768_10870 [Acaryochloris sp. CRU_2_0]|nr:hypothetical protein [Acaryochloris sp. CRU_2_0]
MTKKATETQPSVWCNKHEATKILGVSESTLKKLRLTNQLIEGIHWTHFSSRCVRYNVELLKDWAANRMHTVNHDRAIANFFNSLPSGQTQPRRKYTRKAS